MVNKCKNCKVIVNDNCHTKICDNCANTVYCAWPLKTGNPCPGKRLANANYCDKHKCYSHLDNTKIDKYKNCIECKSLFDDTINKRYCNSCLDTKICVWNTKDGNRCYYKRKKGVNHCGTHACYSNFDINKINEYPKCGTCKLLFVSDDKLTTCKPCRNIGEKNRKNAKQKIVDNDLFCIHIDKEKGRCKFQKNNDCEFKEYCGNHQSYARFISEKDKGNKICYNWVRGCWNVVLNNESCVKCLAKNNNYNNEKYHEKKDKSEKYNKDNDNTNNRMCFLCNKIVDKSIFKKDKCFNCYESQQKHENNCNRKMDDYDVKYKSLKYNTSKKRRDIEFKLEKEDCIKIWDENCVFCNTDENIGIDRIDPELGYIIDNVQPCCYTCNIMKGTKFNNDKFLSVIKYILSYKKILNKNPKSKYCELFECSKNELASYKNFLNENNKRNIKVDITETEYLKLIKEKCYYCGNHENGAKGIDRKNSKIFYTKDNIVSCCKTCNFIKKTLSEDEFINNLIIIYNNNFNNNIKDKNPYYTKIDLNAHVIMNKNQEEYENLLYTKNIDNTKYDKIELEYIENEEQINNWNYFVFHYNEHLRNKIIKNTESFNFFVKYKEKYIGMISVDKDNYANDTRDNYIKWSKDIKMKNFDNIIKLKFIKNFTDNDDFKTLFPTLLNSDYVKNIYKNKIGKNIYWISIYDNLKDYENNEKYTYIEDNTNANNKPMICIKVKNIEKLCKETKNSKNSNVIINDSSSIKKLKKNNFIITI